MLSGNELSSSSVEIIQQKENFEEYILKKNGLKILLYPNSSMPVATVMVTYNVGSRNEQKGVTGATHILEHMMFKGTKKFPLDKEMDYSNQMERIGARSNATTSYDRTNYYATLASEHVPMAIELEADRMRNLQINENSLASEMVVVKNEYERRENNPYATLQKQIFSTAFSNHPYHHPIIGWKEDIESITVDKLKIFYDQFYWPNNAVLSIIGGFDKKEALSAIETYFGSISKSPKKIPTLSIEEPIQKERRMVKVYRSGKVGAVLIAYKTPEGTHPDWAPLLLLTEIMGADKIGRLYKSLEDQGLASASYIFPRQLKDPGLLITGATLTANTSHEQIQDILLKTVGSVSKHGITDDELDRAKINFKTNLIYAKDGSFNIADALNDAIALGDWEYYLKISDQIESVSKEDIQRVAKTYLNSKNQTIGWYIPKEDPGNLNGVASLNTNNLVNNLAKPYYFNETFSKLDFLESDFTSAINFTPKIKEIFISNIHLATLNLEIDEVISCSGSIPVGDALSPTELPLLAELTASMIDKGTRNMNRFEIAKTLDSRGIELRFNSTNNALYFEGKFLKKDTETFIKILSDILRFPKFDSEVLDNLKEQYNAYLLELETETDEISKNQLARALYPKNHPNFSTKISKLRESLPNITSLDLENFHKSYYGDTSMKIVFAGDVNFPKIQKFIRNYFSKWKTNTKYKTEPKNLTPNTKKNYRIFIPDKTSVSVSMGSRTFLKRNDSNYLAFSIANYILGGNFNSRLMQSLRQEKGLTYSVNSFHEGDILNTGNWALNASFSPQILSQGLMEIRKELLDWHINGVTQEEVSQAIETIKGNYLVGLSQSNTVARQVHSFMLRGFAPTYIDIYPKLLKRVTENQVNQAIKDYFNPNSIVTVVSGSLIEGSTTSLDIKLEFKAPNPAWNLKINEIFEDEKSIFVIAKVDSKNAITSQIISTISDQVTAEIKDSIKPIRYYVIGKKWNWDNSKEEIIFINKKEDLKTILKNASPVNFKKKFF